MLDNSLSLAEIESTLKKNLFIKKQTHVLTIWGDLNLSEDEFSILAGKLHDVFSISKNSLKDLLDRYSISVTTAAVFMSKYRYDKNFWGAFGDELGRYINPAQQGQIGSMCLDCFQTYGLEYDVKDVYYKFVDPICYEAGVPTAGALDDLFFAVKYDSNHNFDPTQLIDDLVYERTYKVRKSLMKYLKQFRDNRAIDCLLEIHDSILSVEQGLPGDSWYRRSYALWNEKDQERVSKEEKKEKQDIAAKPFLVLDERYGLCMQMPKLFLEQEYVETPKWTILCDDTGREIERTMSVFDDFGRRRIGETRIPVPLAGIYTILLTDPETLDDEELIEPWRINGIADGSVLFFNSEGRIISPKFLPYPYVTLLFSDANAKIVSQEYVEDNFLSYPFLNGTSSRLISIIPQDYRSKLTVISCGKEIHLEARPRIDVSLTGNRLFSTITKNELPVFTELPVLTLGMDDINQMKGLEVRCGQAVLGVTQTNGIDQCTISLSNYQNRCFSNYGVYSIRIYSNGLFLKSVDFGYAPYVETSYDPLINMVTNEVRRKNTELDFDCEIAIDTNPNLDVELEFDNCIVKHTNAHYAVECPINMGVLTGALLVGKSEDGNMGKIRFPFSLPLRPFDISILKSEGEPLERQVDNASYRITQEDISQGSFWMLVECYGDYINKDYYLKLNTVDGYIQTERLKKNSGTVYSCSLSTFSDTLQNCPLPARLELFNSDDFETGYPVATITKESILEARPIHSYHDGMSRIYFKQFANKKKDLILRPFTSPDRKYVLPYEKSMESATSRGTPIRVYTRPELAPGFYSVSVGEDTEDPFGFEEEFGVTISNGYDTLYVTKTPKRSLYQSFSDWLDSLMTDIMSAGPLNTLDGKDTYHEITNGGLNRWKNDALTASDFSRLIALAWLATDKHCSKTKLMQIQNCMGEISCIILNAESRARMAKHLLMTNCPPQIIRNCIQSYDFLLMSTAGSGSEIIAEQLAPYSDELEVFMQMGRDAPMREVFSEKGLRVLGKDALLQMITVPEGADPTARRDFLRERKESAVSIELPPELAGKEDLIEPLLVYGRKDVYLNLNKMPEEGLPFNGTRFAELYVNWFRIRINRDRETRSVQLLDEETERLMIKAIQEDCVALMKSYKAAGNDPKTHFVQKRYNHGIRQRFTKDPTANLSNAIPIRFFYVQAVAAFLALMPDRYHPNQETTRTAQHFLSMASRVAPRLVRRDLMMAQTFYYLIGKEETLCQ